MSRRKDRERAESGIIFRDGHYVNKDEWYAAHPTRQMLAERQAKVDEAVTQEMAAKRLTPKQEREAAGAPPFDYWCSKCKHPHKYGSKVHEQHQDHAEPIDKHS
jgi:hypothetical protein